MASDDRPHRQKSVIKAAIPRSHSEFCYVSLTPKEKRRTTDFSHLLPQFNKDPPYVRLLDPKIPIMEQPKPLPATVSKMCRSSTASPVSRSPTLDVIRSHSMRSLRRTLEMSPTKYRVDGPVDKHDTESSDGSPDTSNLPDLKDMTRMRNFSVTPKGVVNWGDSFRSRSMPFVPTDGPSSSSSAIRPSSSGSVLSDHKVSPNDCAASLCSKTPTRYRVVILGSSNVGKTTMIRQFKTSEYICALDSGTSDDSSDYALTVILNGEESELEFIDSCSMDHDTDEESAEGKECKLFIPTADAYVVVYSVTSRRSYLHGMRLLQNVQSNFLNSPVIFVGNKSDLVRIRAVTTDEGRASARERNCPFMETSVAINHQVDELLVTILTEIRNRSQPTASSSTVKFYSQCNLSKAKGLIKKFLKKACFQSKSCDNLQRL